MMMKKVCTFVFLALLVTAFLQGAYVGKVYLKHQGEQQKMLFKVPKNFLEAWALRERTVSKAGVLSGASRQSDNDYEDYLSALSAYFMLEEKKGNIRLRLVQDDPEAKMEHYRYTQYYEGLEVFGGEILTHYKEGNLIGISGEFYKIDELDPTPHITKEMAVGLFEANLGKFDLTENSEKTKLIVYPIKDGDYHLAYRIILNGGAGYSMTGIVDAKTGEVLLKYSNIYTDDLTIGRGLGCHGEQYKFPTTLQNEKYSLMDLKRARPVGQYTFDFRTYDGHYYYVAWDEDNNWDYDGALVSAHSFLGLTYDYYYEVFGRKGIDSNNLDIKATVHWYDGSDNAFWDSERKQMYFLDPGSHGYQYAGAIDIVAHEYSHGITDYTSGLIYFWQSGALNESFSDIIGTAIEFYWQEPGNGLLKADWLIGEDSRSYFSVTECRNLANPNANSQMKNAGYPSYLWYPDPCHLSQEMPLIIWYGDFIDNGGVHINSTIYSHAFYLLANGGTNRVSGKSVAGIGIEKATKIFYRAWAYWMTPTSNFWNAANYLLWSTSDLYGSASNEYAQTIKAMEAIGWIVI